MNMWRESIDRRPKTRNDPLTTYTACAMILPFYHLAPFPCESRYGLSCTSARSLAGGLVNGPDIHGDLHPRAHTADWSQLKTTFFGSPFVGGPCCSFLDSIAMWRPDASMTSCAPFPFAMNKFGIDIHCAHPGDHSVTTGFARKQRPELPPQDACYCLVTPTTEKTILKRTKPDMD